MKLVGYLFALFLAYVICYLIYVVILQFIETTKQHKIFKKQTKLIEKTIEHELTKLINGESTINFEQDEDDSIYDKSDEELLEDWNDLWGGNPPCELDLKTIREEERKEREKKGE